FADYVEPILRILPEIPKPIRRKSLREKFMWTGAVVILYFIMAQIPLYGIPWSAKPLETLFFLQVVLASSRGTLLELGIGPIVTSGMIWQLLVGGKIINIDLSTSRGRALFTGLEKLFAIIFTFIEAAAYIMGGAYGRLSISTSIIVFLQLVSASIILMLMDELIQKGYGLGSGVSLFIAANVSQRIFWSLLSPYGPMDDGLYYGVIPALAGAIYNATVSGRWDLVREAIIRPSGWPSVLGLILMLLLFFILIYLENTQIEIPISLGRYGGFKSKIPLKFLYVSNIPIILMSALLADLHIFAQLAWNNFNRGNKNEILNYIIKYNVTERGYQAMPHSLVYYLSPPRGIQSILKDPIQVAIYSIFFIIFSVIFSIAWVETSGIDARSQAQQLAQSDIQIPGFRKSPKIMANLLNRYIPTLTVLSGLLVAIIAITSDILGILGGGIGILLLVGILVQYQSILMREQALEYYPMLRKLIPS
ncbi:MAG TPA: preprotein translocase subunit SecY, partial [Thermoprotei archaeon]|nr:preprotein translocase subunit SecY [Thermoprotei archaeon]